MDKLWLKLKPLLQERIGSTAFETWFGCVEVKEGEKHLIFELPNAFFKDWVIEHYANLIKELLAEVNAVDFKIEFKVNPSLSVDLHRERLSEFQSRIQPEEYLYLNPRFTFENFVVGPSNRFAHAACLAVANSLAKAYNPLFIYGGVGLGKTHLMQAICHYLKRHSPQIKISYTTSERFTNELIRAIQHRSTARFRQRYREVDLLLIDDIHFLAGKESTQEEFFHTFNTLYDNHKQIVISSDRLPKEIPGLEERLVSRFSWGLVTDIQPPDFETRVAILRKKIEKEPVRVPEEVICFIAERITTNIRELEGALIRVVAYSLLEEKEISLDLAKDVLKDMLREVSVAINIDLIQKKTAEFFNLSVEELKSKRRTKNLMLPRQLAMYLARKLTNFSLLEIGSSFGGKDHTTVLHACRKIKSQLDKDRDFQQLVKKLLTHIKKN